MAVLSDLRVSDECACGRPGKPPCQYGVTYDSIVPLEWITRGSYPVNATDLQKKCYAEVKAIYERLRPENVIWEGMDPLYVAVDKEWHDPAKRSKLLERMAVNIRDFKPPTMPDVDFIRLWAVRLRAYLALLSSLALYDVIPPTAGEDLNLYFRR